MATGISPRSAATPTALQPASLLQSQYQEHKPTKIEEVSPACFALWVKGEKGNTCTNCYDILKDTEARSISTGSTGTTGSSSTSAALSSSSSPAPAASPAALLPALAVGPTNPMLMSSQLDRYCLPPFVTVQTSKIFITRMMHLWVATGATWSLETAWNWGVEFLEWDDCLKLTPTHTTLWVAIAASVYLLATHTSEWFFPNPSNDNPPSKTYLKTLKFLTSVHVAAAISSYFKIWVHPFKGIACMGVTFAAPYNIIEKYGIPTRRDNPPHKSSS